MKTVCKLDMCAGCMACIDICPKKAITIKDDLVSYNAIINENMCIECGACYKVCQYNNSPNMKSPEVWYQGWAEDEEIRKSSSSGGYATAIANAFIDNGGIVCSCIFKSGKFLFDFATNIVELKNFSGSKYVKSNPTGIYKSIKCRLKKGEKILFIGLPCQVSALRIFVGKELENNLYTCDLICHGTPSPKLLNMFLLQYGKELPTLNEISFRKKAKFMMSSNNKGIITDGVSDKYSIAFLNSLIYTENCYACKYAKQKRVSDLTLGDSWGSNLNKVEKEKGISLVLCQTIKGRELLKKAKIHIENVDLKKSIENNHQLERPSEKPVGRKNFFKQLTYKKFNKVVFKQLPKQCLRQDIKRILITLKLLNR